MTDQELRDMIRESIARHAGANAEVSVRLPAFAPHASAWPRHGADDDGRREGGKADTPYSSAGTYGSHASHVRLAMLQSGDDDGACLVEPAVRCTHCGFCLSYGH